MKNNYFYELIESQFDNHKDPEITERVIGRHRDFEPLHERGSELAKELEESGRFKDWSFLHEKIQESSIVFFAEKYDEKTDHIKQYAITIEKKNF